MPENKEKTYIENGYMKLFGNSYHSIYVNENKNSAVLITNGEVVTTTTYDNLSYFENKYKDQDLPIYILTVRQSVIHSWVVLGNMEPFMLPGTINDISIFENGYIVLKDPIKDTLFFLSLALLKGKDIKKVSSHVFTFIENSVVKYVNLEKIDVSAKNRSVSQYLEKNIGLVCTLADNYEYKDDGFTVYQSNGLTNRIEIKQ